MFTRRLAVAEMPTSRDEVANFIDKHDVGSITLRFSHFVSIKKVNVRRKKGNGALGQH
jgi:hypothetical protein